MEENLERIVEEAENLVVLAETKVLISEISNEKLLYYSLHPACLALQLVMLVGVRGAGEELRVVGRPCGCG